MTKLLAEGVDVSDVISLAGYVGPTTEGGPVQLFPSLQDLSVYVEIPADEILHVEKADETTPPKDGVIVWLRNDSAVTFKRTRTVQTAARAVRHLFGGPGARTELSAGAGAGAGAPLPGAGAPFVESRSGRLRIMTNPSPAMWQIPCASYCFGGYPCHSPPVCQSRGCA
ncbi:hypothetical protein [Streptomyces sp. NPDC002908]|uniref:hypothetical protein n=1 Tax=Streptomyces sp. NPDC002908 TaxID=3364670 RepID=UPI003688D5E7